jgi:hypothetical protein
LTIPTGIWEAIAGKNDTMVALCNFCVAALVVLYLRQPGNWFYAAGIGISLALGLCIKSTTFIIAAPFVGGAVLWLAWRRSWRSMVQLTCVLAAASLVINFPWMWRNHQVFGRFLGPASGTALVRNKELSSKQGLANVVRNLSLYTGTPSAAVTETLNNLIYALGVCTGRPLADTSYIATKTPFHFQEATSTGATNDWYGCHGYVYIHAWLALLALAGLLVLSPRRDLLALYAAAIGAGFCLFCFYLRWEPWASRYHLATFVMAMPLVALCTAAVAHRLFMAVIGALLLVNAFLVLFSNPLFPLNAKMRLQDKPREEQLFILWDYLYRPYCELATDIIERGCTNVLLKSAPNTFEYPLWVCLKNRGFKGTIEHTLVRNDATSDVVEKWVPHVGYEEQVQPHNETAPLSRCDINERTAIVFLDCPAPNTTNVTVRGHAQPLLAIGYYIGRITALYPSAHPGKWTRLVRPENRGVLIYLLSGVEGIGPQKPVNFSLGCNPIDRNGRTLTNSLFLVNFNSLSGEVNSKSGSLVATGAVTQSVVLVNITLLRASPGAEGPFGLKDIQGAWEWSRH